MAFSDLTIERSESKVRFEDEGVFIFKCTEPLGQKFHINTTSSYKLSLIFQIFPLTQM